ncbi:3'-5' exonuclease [Aureliella helgolandensis]|uniref:DNA polymerase III subunit epsilon n=1 Tax=Aureliella helgolandensis TaxID=2527968 RepID=A0A518GBU7_9BACT|nr:3'-5' exonuclease [Aureliella helgolandensis]QDV26059.1 DNA polymerase III subunit epsilon [Aureliella helgolandensis]
MATESDLIISVDVETSGPIPGEYSMLSLGAWILGSNHEFYVEFQPLNDNAVPEALSVTGFSLDALRESGKSPKIAMAEFGTWIEEHARDRKPVMAGFNVGFDWSFVNWYFHRFMGANPLGFTSIDIKSLFMGLAGCSWPETKSSRIPDRFQPTTKANHNALDDAKAQGEMLAAMICASRRIAE